MTMQIEAANVTSVYLRLPHGAAKVLFSYTTPVAAWLTREGETKRYRATGGTVTSRKHSAKYGPLCNKIKGKGLAEGDLCEEVTEEELARIIEQFTERTSYAALSLR